MSSLVSDALTTVAEVETLLGLSSGADTARITNAINHATGRILKYIDRTIASTTYTEYYDGTGTRELVLSEYPLIGNPTEVNVDNGRDFLAATKLTISTDYVVESLPTNRNPGILRRTGTLLGGGLLGGSVWPRGMQNIKVSYTAGYASTPELLLRVCTEYAAYFYAKRGTHGNIRHAMGGIMIEEDHKHWSGIPAAFRGDLDGFRRPDLDDLFDLSGVPTLL